MPGVVLSGAETPLGRRVTARINGDGDGVGLILGGDLATTRRALADATAANLRHVVYASSATVYGAWADNAVPLSESIPLRPNPGAAFAVDHAEGERLVGEWKRAAPARTATVLRPTTMVGSEERPRLAPLLVGYAGLAVRGGSRRVQAVHVDDVASAAALAVARNLDGTFNVAPDGWITDATARAVAGGPVRLALPAPVVRALTRLPAPALAYAMHPWVIANDRLRAEGWTPEHSNEEALVATHAASWRDLSPRRRQELALALFGLTLAGAVVALTRVVRSAHSLRSGEFRSCSAPGRSPSASR